MSCPRCGYESPDGARFCAGCGAGLSPPPCPACGAPTAAGARFCAQCGTPLGGAAPAPAFRPAEPTAYTPRHLADKILTSRTALEGERKQLTVLFTDVSGFTSLSERLDPEEVHEIMDRTFEVVLEAVHRYEGTVNQFLGDGVMALFGAPIAHEDHAHRAVRAALAVQEGLAPVSADVARRHGVPFRMRMGLNTGLVVVGAIGRDLRMDYTAVGDTTNLAARMLALAPPGQIVMTATTHRLTEGYFDVEDLGAVQVKGKREPINAYAVRAERRGRTRLEVSRERGLTPLAGRERELAWLAGRWERAAAGRGGVAVLTGEPGVGKSRLLYEFVRRLPAGVREIEATCVSHGQRMPFHPVLSLVRTALGAEAAQDAADVRAAVAARVAALGLGGPAEADLLAAFLGAGTAEATRRAGAPEQKQRTLDLLRDLLLAPFGDAPGLLVVENVHWIDASSDEFVRRLAGAVGDHRVLLVLTGRNDGFPAALRALGERLALAGVTREAAGAIARDVVGAREVAAPLVALLLEKGEGNPLYVEEIVRQLRETGALVVEDGTAGLRSVDVSVPQTIHDIIASRVDRLADALKHTLQAAAVIGRRFAAPLVSRVLDTVEASVVQGLRELAALEFVFAADAPAWTFKHALTQDVVYSGLLERRRRRYHAVVGRALEELSAGRVEEIAELLAHHFARSGDDDKAVDYAIVAGEVAQRRWASAEAVSAFEAALARLDTMDDTPANRTRRLDAVVKQAEVMFALGRVAEHIQTLERVRPLIEGADARRRAAWHCWTGLFHSLTGTHVDVPIEHCRQASAIAEEAGLDGIRAMAESCLCQVYAYAGRMHDALAAGERALAMFEAQGDVWWACRTLWGLSLVAIPLGRWAESLQYCRRALAHGERTGDRRLRIVASWRTGWTCIQRGDAAGGLVHCDAALALAPGPFDTAMTRAARGYGLVKAGRPAEGLAELEAAVAWFEQAGLRFTRSWYAIWLADGYLRLGRDRDARALAEEVLALSRRVGYRYFEGLAERLLGTAWLAEDGTAAAAHLDAADGILKEVGALNELARVRAARADLADRAGATAEARAARREALAMFEALDTVDEVARLRLRITTDEA